MTTTAQPTSSPRTESEPGVPWTRKRQRRRRGLVAWGFMLPLVAVNVLVILGPSLASVYYSLTDWSGLGGSHFIGLDNYKHLLHDPDFRNALWHNVYWTVLFLTVPMAMGLLGAYLLSRVRRGQVIFRTLFFIPYIVATVVSSAIWSNLLSPDYGVGKLLNVNFLGNGKTALTSVAFVNNWAWWGFLVVIFFSAMRSVDPTLYEAAQLDGASPSQQYRYITLPAIRPTLMFMGLMTIIWSFLVFDYIYILTQGGPAGATDVLGTVLYRDAFANQEAGYAAAIGVVLALMSTVIVSFYLFLRRRRDWEI
jgi:raffinose/stachyose/melibiose transport system permease protein